MDVRLLTVEVRDKNLNRLGQIAPVDLDILVEDQVNNVGSWTLNLRSDHPLADALRTPGAGIVVSDTSGDTLMSGPVTETDDKATVEDPGGTLTINGLTDTLILADRVAFPDPGNADPETQAAAYDVRTGATEDLMHAYVDANVGPSAPTGRRITSLTMGTNGHRGSTVTKRARFDVLGTLVNDLALTSGLGFRIRQVASGLKFETFAVSDRSADVRYDIYNNMLSGHSAQTAPPGVTRAIVGGDGAKLARPLVEVTNSASLAAESLWGRRIEQFIDQRSTADAAELAQAGAEALQDAGFAQTGIQVVPMEDIGVGDFGTKFVLGDLVTVVVNGVQYTVQVTGYVLKRNSEGLKFGLVLGNPLGKQEAAQVTARVTKLEGRVSNLERNAEPGGGGAMAELTDVTLTSPATRDILQWDGASGKWVNKPTLVLTGADANADVYALAQPGDTNQRWKVKGDGKTWWGPGNATQDTNLYRSAANVLATDDSLSVAQSIDAGSQVSVQRAAVADHAFRSKLPADTQWRMVHQADGKLLLGDGTSLDTNLYRSAANTLKTDDTFDAAGLNIAGTNVLAKVYPVGAIYLSTVNTSPATLFGFGTWTQITDTFLMAAGTTYAAASTGGAASVTLTEAQLPSHTHTFSATTDTQGTHTHSIGRDKTGATGSIEYINHSTGTSGAGQIYSGQLTSDGAHTHNVSGTTAATGSGTAVPTLPPYVAVYVWKRTA